MDRSKVPCCLQFFTDKARRYRYEAMILICIIGVGSLACYESSGSLQEPFMEHMDLSAYQFSLTYSINSWPVIVLSFFGGFIVDRFFEINWGTIIFLITAIVGHFTFSLGVYLGIFWLALVGRFIYGVGVEMMYICLQCIVIIWFKGQELSMVFGLLFSSWRVGSFVMYEMAPALYNALKPYCGGRQAIGIVFFIAGLLPFVSLGSGFILRIMDPKKYEKKPKNENSTKDVGHNKMSLRSVNQFPLCFWLILLTDSAVTTSVSGLLPFTQGYFMNDFGLTMEAANRVTSLFSILAAVMAPLAGIVVDQKGRIVSMLTAGISTILLSHLILTFTPVSPYVGMFFLSIGFAWTTASTVPLISFIIPEHQLATAFGLNCAFLNLIFSVNLIVGGILVDEYNYTTLQFYNVSWTILGLLAAVCLWFQDRREKGILNLSADQRKLFEIEKSLANDVEVPLKTECA